MASLNLLLPLTVLRLRAVWDGPAPASPAPEDYTLRREGLVPCDVEAVWVLPDGHSVEIVPAEPLLPGLEYTLDHASGGRTLRATLRLSARSTSPALVAETGDPAAQAFGVDVDWLADDLTSGRDLPEVRGLAAFRHDCAVVAFLEPGELVHRPRAGAGVLRRVNGPGAAGTLGETAADVRAALLGDPRTASADVEARISPEDGNVTLSFTLLTRPLPDETITFDARLPQ